jgi:hypothetical protein
MKLSYKIVDVLLLILLLISVLFLTSSCKKEDPTKPGSVRIINKDLQ